MSNLNINEYYKNKYIQINVKLNKDTDGDIIQYLKNKTSTKGMRPYIIELIRKDIKNNTCK